MIEEEKDTQINDLIKDINELKLKPSQVVEQLKDNITNQAYDLTTTELIEYLQHYNLDYIKTLSDKITPTTTIRQAFIELLTNYTLGSFEYEHVMNQLKKGGLK